MPRWRWSTGGSRPTARRRRPRSAFPDRPATPPNRAFPARVRAGGGVLKTLEAKTLDAVQGSAEFPATGAIPLQTLDRKTLDTAASNISPATPLGGPVFAKRARFDALPA